jgi:hypothetical protein
LVGFFDEVNPSVSFTTTTIEDRIKELNEIMGNLDLGETTDRSDLNQKDFTTQSGYVSSSIHQICVIITQAAEENDNADNTAVDAQGNKPRSSSGKEKEKIYVSTGEWRIIMSAINHGTEVPTNSRREVLMGYQYALHQHKKKLQEEKASSEEARRTTGCQVKLIGMNTAKHLTPAKKDIVNQSIAEEKHHGEGSRATQGALAHNQLMKKKTSYKKHQMHP